MNIKQLQLLIQNQESETLEFKTSTKELHGAFETLCAFLNTHGGVVLIGVNDSGKIVGQQISDQTKRDIANEIKKIEPTIQARIIVKYVPISSDKKVIVLEVEQGAHMPYTYDGRPFVRIQTATHRMTQHGYEQLIVERGQLNHAWENLPASGYDIDSLDHEEIRRTIDIGVRSNRIPPEAINESIEEILEHRFELMLSNGIIKNAGVVLFAKKLYPRYPQCLIKMARFKGTEETGDFIDNQRFYGNAFQILSAADHFVMRHLPIASFFSEDKYERHDKPALPVLALREALINSICHRDYSIRSSAIFLSIFDDRLEIWNNGSLPSQLKIGDLKKPHKSYPRNEKIAEIFYSRGLIETWGRGIGKMLSLCSEFDIPEPEFNEYSGGLGVTFKFREPMTSVVKIKKTKMELSQRQEEILAIIRKRTLVGTKIIMAELQTPLTQRVVQKELNQLRTLKLVASKGRGKATVWFLV